MSKDFCSSEYCLQNNNNFCSNLPKKNQAECVKKMMGSVKPDASIPQVSAFQKMPPQEISSLQPSDSFGLGYSYIGSDFQTQPQQPMNNPYEYRDIIQDPRAKSFPNQVYLPSENHYNDPQNFLINQSRKNIKENLNPEQKFYNKS